MTALPAEPAARLDALRARYPTFVYEAYDFEQRAGGDVECRFRFRAGDLAFAPTCRFTFAGPGARRALDRDVLANLVFHLGLAEVPSYWKATCSPRIEVPAGPLDDGQRAFWTRLLTDGMGEFHHANRTPFTEPGFVTIDGGPARGHRLLDGALGGGALVPIGGGKDSLVTLELLARRPDDVTTFAINPPPSTVAAIDVAGVATRVTLERRLDPRLLELNAAGFLNGHTPFGAVIAFASALAAAVAGRGRIAVSNESSSDHAPLRYRGRVINHQYGKSWALEVATRRYLAEHVAGELHYLSALRPFNELQIAARFAQLAAFLPIFRSCNRGRRTDTWCGRCAKCVSTFVTLAPFVDRAELVRLVGRDPLADADGQAVLSALLAEDGDARPFECVATPAELRAALELAGGGPVGPATIAALADRAAEHDLPDDLYRLFDAALRPRVAPLLGRTPIAVVGLGLEGTSTCAHLLAAVDPLDVTVVDDDPAVADRLPAARIATQTVRFRSGREAAAAPPDAGVVFKAPGVAPDHPAMAALRRPATLASSNTELFFERRRGTVVGVTGTKGKSTTTSLIAHALRAAGRDARLIGNIGTPCLDDAGGTADTIYCVELAAFQLERLPVSPDVAVVLGIFGDHLDRFGDLATYSAAKSAIARHQTAKDVVIYNRDCPRASAIAQLGGGRRVPFGRERPALLGDRAAPLLGEFNHYNLWPAIHVGRLFGVSDAELAAAIHSFRPLPGRLETVAERDGVRFVCDIRSTAPEVTVAALDALTGAGDRVEFLLVGGVDRGQDYATLVPAVARSAVRHVILFPPTGARVRAALAPLADRLVFFEPSSMEDAIRYVYRHAPAAPSVCLMSTAAPSRGGLFTGPEDKAEQFVRWATQLGREGA